MSFLETLAHPLVWPMVATVFYLAGGMLGISKALDWLDSEKEHESTKPGQDT